jgi:glycosyltransferase involved in cell wall biosynthesis
MPDSCLVIVKDTAYVARPHEVAVTFDEFKRWVYHGTIVRRAFGYREVRLQTHRIGALTRPFLTMFLLRLMARGTCLIQDDHGASISIDARTLARLGRRTVRDLMHRARLLRDIEREIEDLGSSPASRPRPIDQRASPVYLRTDLVFGLTSGGSVGHIAGVLNKLDGFTGPPIFLTSDAIPSVRSDIETHVIPPDGRFADFLELPAFAFNDVFDDRARRHLEGRGLAFVYQRYSLNSYVGVQIARRHGIPLVLEYNGSEVWVNRNWGRRLKYEALSDTIESFDLAAADVVVVVSQTLARDLVHRGVDRDKVLVNPNGVDPDRYSPAVDGGPVRERLGLDDRIVVGFIGTFGPWHGAEVLAEAFGRLVARRPEYREGVRLLMIGDGPTVEETRRRIRAGGVGDETLFVGRTAQEDGPAYLAACDILVSPHVPNVDGSPFFGSPTKLFEYMAMGKGIVASRLEQIGEVLDHERTAWLVEPGDVDALANGLERLIDDPALRERLGRAAREDAVAKHTWYEHTRRIIEKLQSRYA